MTDRKKQANPDDRSDNVEKLQQMVQDTIANMEAADETAQFASNDTREKIQAKNERRKDAIENMKAEMADESENQQDM